MPKVSVQIDPSACILAANCVGIEPKLFQIGQESYVELIDADGAVHENVGTVHMFTTGERRERPHVHHGSQAGSASCPAKPLTYPSSAAHPFPAAISC